MTTDAAKRRLSGRSVSGGDLLKMGELARAADVSPATVKHYLREKLLPPPVRKSRNMAYYSAECVERIKLIKQLQEERFVPLKVIQELVSGAGPEVVDRLRSLIEMEDRILERALVRSNRTAVDREEIVRRYDVPADVLDKLQELGVVTSRTIDGRPSYGPEDVQIIEAVSRMRDSGYSEALGFTVYDALIYKRNLEKMVQEEAGALIERTSGKMTIDELTELVGRGVEPLRDLIAAMRAKLLVSELRSRR